MEKLIKIATFNYPSELAVVRTILESNDINCFVKDELTIQTHNFYSNAIGGIKLEVPYKDCEKALSILMESGNKNYISIDLETEEKKDQNEKLNNLLKNIIRIVVGISIIFILVILILVFFYD